VVYQDVRGRYKSEGTFTKYINEPEDGYDTVEWLAKQPYSNGKIGMRDGSYVAHVQAGAAKLNPPYFSTILVTVGGTSNGWTHAIGSHGAFVQKHIGSGGLPKVDEFIAIDADTIRVIKEQRGGDGTKVINSIKSIERTADESSDDPFLIAMADRARAVQESFEERQLGTADALNELIEEIEKNEARRAEQARRGLDAVSCIVLCKLVDDGMSCCAVMIKSRARKEKA